MLKREAGTGGAAAQAIERRTQFEFVPGKRSAPTASRSCKATWLIKAQRQPFPGKKRNYSCHVERYDNDLEFCLCMRKAGIPREYTVPKTSADGKRNSETEVPGAEAEYRHTNLWRASRTYGEIKSRIMVGELLVSLAHAEPEIELPRDLTELVFGGRLLMARELSFLN